MSFNPKHLLRRAARLTAVAALFGALSGCQAVNNAPVTQVRIVNASPDARGLDIYNGSDALAFNLGSGTVTSYVPLPPGTYPIAAAPAGTRQNLTTSTAPLAASTHYTV